jgi:tRNA/tmRNA/rRNA uracil-C5-methylase (TrmA/RlmC/RlmD family)
VCGGCPLIDLPEAAQQRAKLAALTAELLAQRVPVSEISWISGEAALGYRNRLRLRVLDSGELAFFNPQKHVSCCVLEAE